MDPWERLAAERLAREMELLEERHALAREEEARRREEASRFMTAASRRREQAAAAGLNLPGPEGRSPAEWLELLERVAPALEALGPGQGSLGKLLTLLQQWKGVQAMARELGGEGGRTPGASQDLARIFREGDAEGALQMARGQRLDRETVEFLRSLGVEAREGEEMTAALRRLATGLTPSQKAEVQAKASKLLERLIGS